MAKANEKRADLWMPLYISDYLADTLHLSVAEHGAYMLMLMHAWMNNGSLPASDDRLRRIARMDADEWREAGPELRSYFYEVDGSLRHHRLDRELDRAKANIEQRSNAGKASAEARRRKRDGGADFNGDSTSVATDDERTLQRDGERESERNPNENADLHHHHTITNTPHSPPSPVGDEGYPPVPQKKERVRRPKSTFKTFVDQCRAAGEKPVSDYRPLLTYVEKVKLPLEFVDLCWQEFKADFLPGGKNDVKRQADWRAHFLNFVRKNYYRLWFVKDGQYVLTTAGEQAKLCHAPGTQAGSGND